MKRASILVAFGFVIAGCATTSPARRGATAGSTAESGTPDAAHAPASERCATRARVLAAAARQPSGPALLRGASGWAMVWSEALGNRAALRFFAVDDAGRPRSPSAEIADRDGAIGELALVADGDGYVARVPVGDGYVARWSEGAHAYSRKIDARGRPRSDVTASDEVEKSAASPTSCADSANGPRCTTRRGAIELPVGAKIAAEQIAEDHAAVIAADAAGLSLYLLECAASASPANGAVPASASAAP